MIYNPNEAARFKQGEKVKCMLDDNCTNKANQKSRLDDHTPCCGHCQNKVTKKFDKFIFETC